MSPDGLCKIETLIDTSKYNFVYKIISGSAYIYFLLEGFKKSMYY